ncbi:DUF981 family protein [Marinitoga litoralis]|uniref:DUF981 family protein n=1 Tax=Marinitoga litoralis TaxID=570855 RepID=UPI0019612C36|nr:DUF981 family protein [Marinitoga litoralis]MBM7559236.1 putative membrane protein [Marinitoga litoralis]
MFIDYLTLFMADIVAGIGLLLYFLIYGLEKDDISPYAPAFFGVGLLGLLAGIHMVYTWPLPGVHNIVFGEPMVLFGIVFIAAAFAAYKNYDLMPVTIVAAFAGIYAIILSYAIFKYGITKHPNISALSYFGAGLTGLLSPFVWKFRNNKLVKTLGIILLALTLLAWLSTMWGSLTGHSNPAGSFGKWKPFPMR